MSRHQHAAEALACEEQARGEMQARHAERLSGSDDPGRRDAGAIYGATARRAFEAAAAHTAQPADRP